MSGVRIQHLALVLACAVPILGALVVSAGLFNTDELIYLTAAEAMASHGSFIVENGFSQFGSDDLKLFLLVDGPNGLTPQYPPGLALLAWPFYVTLGMRGLILFNALAAAGIAIVTWCLAQKLYRSTTIAAISVLLLTFCTFQLDYAWAIWPHMTATFCVLLAFLLALHAMDSQQTRTVLVYAGLSGLAVGLGALLRTDSVLILPIIAACIVFAGTRPILTFLGGALGLIPGLAILAWVNVHKFGTPNVLSYGRTGSGGGDDINSHFGAALLIAVLIVGMLLARTVTWTRSRRIAGLAVVTIGAVVVLAIPTSRAMFVAIADGYMTLFVDSRLIEDPREGVQFAEDGSLLFWGVAKKAMVQSLPWLAILALLVLTPWRKDHIRAHSMLLVFAFVWSLPFAALSWHGGYSSSMRYFLPMLPALVILCAILLRDVASRTSMPVAIAGIGIIAGIAFSFSRFEMNETFTDGRTQQAMNLLIFYVLGVIVIASTVLNRFVQSSNAPALLAVSFGLGVGCFSSMLVDVTYAQKIRGTNAQVSAVTENLSGPLLIYGFPKAFAFAVERPDVIVGWNVGPQDGIDLDLFTRAIRSGFRAVTTLETADYVSRATDLSYTDLDISPSRTWVEIVASPTQSE